MRRNLEVVRESPAKPGVAKVLAAYVDAETEQEGPGVRAAIGLTNEGTSAVSVLNPFATVQFQLQDERGSPVELPASRSSLRDRPEDWHLKPSFPIAAVARNGKQVDSDAIDTRELALEPGDALEASFTIQPVPPGLYRVRGLLSLISAQSAEDSRVLQSPWIETRIHPAT